jgi:hypothetical protein
MKANMPGADLNDSLTAAGYSVAQTLEQVLRQCGDNLTRENIMKQATSLHDFHLGQLRSIALPLLLTCSTCLSCGHPFAAAGLVLFALAPAMPRNDRRSCCTDR